MFRPKKRTLSAGIHSEAGGLSTVIELAPVEGTEEERRPIPRPCLCRGRVVGIGPAVGAKVPEVEHPRCRPAARPGAAGQAAVPGPGAACGPPGAASRGGFGGSCRGVRCRLRRPEPWCSSVFRTCADGAQPVLAAPAGRVGEHPVPEQHEAQRRWPRGWLPPARPVPQRSVAGRSNACRAKSEAAVSDHPKSENASSPCRWWVTTPVLPRMPKVKKRLAAVLPMAVVNNATKLATWAPVYWRTIQKISM